jgi:hypothetical protein
VSEGPREDDEGYREPAPNPTQERIDREGPDDAPGDVSWREEGWGSTERREDDE